MALRIGRVAALGGTRDVVPGFVGRVGTGITVAGLQIPVVRGGFANGAGRVEAGLSSAVPLAEDDALCDDPAPLSAPDAPDSPRHAPLPPINAAAIPKLTAPQPATVRLEPPVFAFSPIFDSRLLPAKGYCFIGSRNSRVSLKSMTVQNYSKFCITVENFALIEFWREIRFEPAYD